MENAKLFEAKLQRILQAAGEPNDAGLARILGIKPPSVAAARKRKQIPSSWVEKIAESYDVNANWLFFGIGPMHLSPVIQTSDQAHPQQEPQEQFEPPTPENEVDYLREENKYLRDENKEFRQDNKELRAEIKELDQDNRRLRHSARDLELRVEMLQEDIAELKQENDKLKLKPDRDQDLTNEDDERRTA